jgi:hypothetical protein
LAEKGNAATERIDALQWILRETSLGADMLPADRAARPLQAAADRLAKAASAIRWSEQKTKAQFDRFIALVPQVRDAAAPVAFSRAEVLTPALRAMVLGLDPATIAKAKSAFVSLDLAIRSPAIFDPKRYEEVVTELTNVVRNPAAAKP